MAASWPCLAPAAPSRGCDARTPRRRRPCDGTESARLRDLPSRRRGQRHAALFERRGARRNNATSDCDDSRRTLMRRPSSSWCTRRPSRRRSSRTWPPLKRPARLCSPRSKLTARPCAAWASARQKPTRPRRASSLSASTPRIRAPARHPPAADPPLRRRHPSGYRARAGRDSAASSSPTTHASRPRPCARVHGGAAGVRVARNGQQCPTFRPSPELCFGFSALRSP